MATSRVGKLLATSAPFASALFLLAPFHAAQAQDRGDTAAATSPDPEVATATANAEPEIVVTARHRDERAQDVPVALSVISGDLIDRRGDFTLLGIQQLAPSLQVFSFNPRNTNMNIRGLGSDISTSNDGLESGVGFYLDDVYYGRSGQSQFDLVDLERVEVLRGPQGTLFGKNTTAGAISVTTRKPEFTFGGVAEATGGNYGYHQVRTSITGPITDWAAFRLSIADTHRDGFAENVTTGRKVNDYDNFTVRGQLLLNPSTTLSVRLIGDFGKQTMNCCSRIQSAFFGSYDDGRPIANNFYDRLARAGVTPLPIDPFARKVEGAGLSQANMNTWGVSGKADWDLGGVTLTSITAYRKWNWYPRNGSGTVLDTSSVYRDNFQRQFSQELRLASNGASRLSWSLGAYYYWQRLEGPGTAAYGVDAPLWQAPNDPDRVRIPALRNFVSNSYSDPQTRSYAAFGQVSYQIVPDKLTAAVGLRYTHEKKNGSFSQWWSGGADLDDPTLGLTTAERTRAIALRTALNPRTSYSLGFTDGSLAGSLTLSYQLARDVMVYGTYSFGGKSGGLNLSNLPTGVTALVEPEKVTNWEAGIKSQWLDRRLTLNLAAFHTKITNYQTGITEQTVGTNSLRYYIANIPGVLSQGVELDGSLTASRNLSLNGSLAYIDAHYLDFKSGPTPVEELNPTTGGSGIKDLSGARLSGSPKFSWNLGADLRFPLAATSFGAWELYGRADYSWRSSFYTASSNSRYSLVESVGIANARIGLRSDDRRWDISLWAKNLLDENYFTTLSVANTGLVSASLGDPRTYGLTLRSRF